MIYRIILLILSSHVILSNKHSSVRGYWIYGESNSSGRGEPIKIKVEKTNAPLKIVIPFPKRNSN